MRATNRPWTLVVLLPFLLLVSCQSKTPKDYELNKTITNEQGSAYYEIFVRSFADSNSDGHGDLNGISAKLPYLQDLGVKGLWLTPIHPSPSDHGYDVTNYYDINPEFGTLDDFDNMVALANEANIDIIIDLVLNHSASSHPWFIEGRTNFRNGNFDVNDHNNKANWYNFYWDEGTVKWEHSFISGMPDLNLSNPAVKEEILNISKFWLDRGLKGFRLDAVIHLFDSASENIAFLKWYSDALKAYKDDVYIVAEAWINSFEVQKAYYSGVDSLFNFNGAGVSGYFVDYITKRNGATLAHYLDANYTSLYALNPDAQMAMFLSNHDTNRSSQMFLFDFDERQKVAASVYLLTPGVPFIYYGEEIAMKGSRMVNETDANRRLPMIWQKENDTMRPGLLPLTDYPMETQVRDGVLEHLNEPFSLLNHYRKVLNVRNAYPWLSHARLANVVVNNNAIASMKLSAKDGSDFIHVLHNVTNEEESVDVSRFIKEYDVKIVHDIFTNKTRATLKGGKLTIPPYSSVILERK